MSHLMGVIFTSTFTLFYEEIEVKLKEWLLRIRVGFAKSCRISILFAQRLSSTRHVAKPDQGHCSTVLEAYVNSHVSLIYHFE